MEAGEYRIYTTIRLTTPDISTDIKGIVRENNGIDVEVYPNPVFDRLTIRLSTQKPEEVNIHVLDITGRILYQFKPTERVHGTQNFNWDGITSSGQKLKAGIYFIKVISGKEHQVVKIIKQ